MKLAILSFLLAAACLLGGCDPRQTTRDLEVAHGDIESPLLYVWAGDEDLNEGYSLDYGTDYEIKAKPNYDYYNLFYSTSRAYLFVRIVPQCTYTNILRNEWIPT